MKLFISYSHEDENHIEDFIKHIAPLRNNGLIEEWYDRKIEAGKDFQNTIDNNLERADIICLFISASFLASKACMKEKKEALLLKEQKGVRVIPIILSPSGWLEDTELKELLAIPTDGKPVTDFKDKNTAWQDVFKWLKTVIQTEIYHKKLKISNDFQKFIDNTELLQKSHPDKDIVKLGDIFIYPTVSVYDNLKEYQKKESSEIILNQITKLKKILIAGEDQSGKTALCKKIFTETKSKGFLPVYLSDKKNQFLGNIDFKIDKALKEQYEDIDIDKIDLKRIIPIIDDFHYAKHKEKHLEHLSKYEIHIIIVDDIFGLNIRQETLIASYSHVKICQFSSSLRYELIKKWSDLTDKKDGPIKDNDYYQALDKRIEVIETALGKVIGKGIMPSYPFFILSIISTYDTFDKPLDKEISSQGYYYQALIFFYLRKQGVKNEHFDTYLNFLTEFSFELYKLKKSEISQREFDTFLDNYLSEYNFPVKKDVLLENLIVTQILLIDSFNNYSFNYQYIYYFFIAKYLAENIDKEKDNIEKIINNLHKNENAYIAIFISHHSNNEQILDEILINSLYLFDKYKPATLNSAETAFFDDKLDDIVKAVLPSKTSTPEIERSNLQKRKDAQEEFEEENSEIIEQIEEDDDELSIELRRSIKTVEVMGLIIRNRSGSMKKTKLVEIFEEGMNVHLRILTSFFDVIKQDDTEKEIVEIIKKRLNAIIEDKEQGQAKELRKDQLEKIAKTIFWNLNFHVTYGFLNKIIHSLGADTLLPVIESVCDKIDTPSSFLIKHGILMWYSKNLQIDNIADYIEKDGFSKTAKNILNYQIANHCALHSINFKDYDRIEKKFGIPRKNIIMLKAKNK
ncbi:MAG: toll/interleukin-1 receptor domain-containing protein [Nanoarchaeota archaeon]|nr:toll/interleukin-1 receptor domain-containing protein [Nanoarchaeota archaeon]